MEIIPAASGHKILVDAADAKRLLLWPWHVRKYGSLRYAVRRDEDRSLIFMHRAIMKPPAELVVDHIDGNGLNNCRSNLRVVAQNENLWNRSDRAEGVSQNKQTGKWRAAIDHEGKRYAIGHFADRAQAVAARAYAASVLRPGFAPPAAAVDRLQFGPSIRKLFLELKKRPAPD